MKQSGSRALLRECVELLTSKVSRFAAFCSKKHVSFARSHTMASFDDAMASLSSSSSHINRMTRSQERLLDVRKADGLPITRQPEPSDNLLIIGECWIFNGPSVRGTTRPLNNSDSPPFLSGVVEVQVKGDFGRGL
jgi:hypothetical protein